MKKIPFNSSGSVFLDKMKKTQGYKKLWNKFKALSKTRSFQDELDNIKQRHSIGSNELTESEWYNNIDVTHELMSLMGKHGFYMFSWQELFIHFAVTGEVLEPTELHSEEEGTIAITTTVEEESLDPFSENTRNHIDEVFPIHIRISPYASGRDITDYINLMYTSFIQPLQSQYINDKNKKRFNTRKKHIENRNDYIYGLRNKKPAEIMSLVMHKYGSNLTPDISNISKIISIEKQRRKL